MGHNKAALEVVIGCLGGFALLIGVVPKVANGPLGLILIVGAALGAVLHLLQPGRFMVRLLELVLFGAVTFGGVYLAVWYFTGYLAARPDALRIP